MECSSVIRIAVADTICSGQVVAIAPASEKYTQRAAASKVTSAKRTRVADSSCQQGLRLASEPRRSRRKRLLPCWRADRLATPRGSGSLLLAAARRIGYGAGAGAQRR